jgi:hypothetical protein
MGCFASRKRQPAEAPGPNAEVSELLNPSIRNSLSSLPGIAVLAMLPSEFGFPDDRLGSPRSQAIIHSLTG